jgi:hypothetical protein
MPRNIRFQPRFDRSQVETLVAEYLADQKGMEQETRAFEAGGRIKACDYNRERLEPILYWKIKNRGKGRLDQNSVDEVTDALRLAVLATTGRAAIAVLAGLYGVNIPVASAILTAIDQEKYTVIDEFALKSLGIVISRPLTYTCNI